MGDNKCIDRKYEKNQYRRTRYPSFAKTITRPKTNKLHNDKIKNLNFQLIQIH